MSMEKADRTRALRIARAIKEPDAVMRYIDENSAADLIESFGRAARTEALEEAAKYFGDRAKRLEAARAQAEADGRARDAREYRSLAASDRIDAAAIRALASRSTGG